RKASQPPAPAAHPAPAPPAPAPPEPAPPPPASAPPAPAPVASPPPPSVSPPAPLPPRPVLTFAAARAPADRPPASGPRRWYGGQTLAVDGAAVAVLVGSAGANFRAGGYLALAVYALGPPAVHVTHGNYGRAGASLGIRLVAPAVLLFAGTLIGIA